MSRYATIITGDDGQEIVSAIGEFEGAAPRARLGRIEQVAPGVLIGMVRGGPVDAVGGFGFALGVLGVGDRAIGTARLMSRLRLAGQSGAESFETAKPGVAIEAKVSPAKPVRAVSKPRKRVARSKSKAAKSRAKKSARSTSRTAPAKTPEIEHG